MAELYDTCLSIQGKNEAKELQKSLIALNTFNKTVDGLTDDDAVGTAQEQTISQSGDVWVPGEHRLMCGDGTDR